MNKSPFLSIFGAIIAFVLFLLYGETLMYMIIKVVSHGMNPELAFEPFHAGITYVVTTIGGLVSALVIAHLAITPSGEDPAVTFTRGLEESEGFESMDSSNKQKTISRSKTLVWIYLGGWLVLGLSALVVGVLIYPEISKTISDLGTTWLGLAVSAAFSYFGLTPSKKK